MQYLADNNNSSVSDHEITVDRNTGYQPRELFVDLKLISKCYSSIDKVMMEGITFVTGNAKKLAEVNHILGPSITLRSRSIDCALPA